MESSKRSHEQYEKELEEPVEMSSNKRQRINDNMLATLGTETTIFDFPTEVLELITSKLDAPTRFTLYYSSKALREKYTLTTPREYPLAEEVERPGTHRFIAGAFVAAAARLGHLGIIRWFRENKFPWATNVMSTAACYGHADIIRWLFDKGCPFDEHVIPCAVSGPCDLPALREIFEITEFPWDKNHACEQAISSGKLDVLRWLREEKECPLNEQTFNAAVKRADVVILEYIREQICPWDWDMWKTAAMEGNLSIIKWLYKNHYHPPGLLCEHAAKSGHTTVIAWARKKNWLWDVQTILNAARYGHMETVRWSYEHGCPWSERVYNMLIEYGHEKSCPELALKYIIEIREMTGYPWNTINLHNHAVIYNNKFVATYLLCEENGHPPG